MPLNEMNAAYPYRNASDLDAFGAFIAARVGLQSSLPLFQQLQAIPANPGQLHCDLQLQCGDPQPRCSSRIVDGV